MQNTESSVVFLALLIVAVSLAALAAAFLYSIPQAVSRIRFYREPGPYRTWAYFNLALVLVPVISLVLFFVVGGSVLALDDGPVRQLIVRFCITAVVFLLSAQVILVPLATRRIEREVIREERDG